MILEGPLQFRIFYNPIFYNAFLGEKQDRWLPKRWEWHWELTLMSGIYSFSLPSTLKWVRSHQSVNLTCNQYFVLLCVLFSLAYLVIILLTNLTNISSPTLGVVLPIFSASIPRKKPTSNHITQKNVGKNKLREHF